MMSTITSTQKCNVLHSIARAKVTELYVYRLRHNEDIEAFVDEVSAVLDKRTLLELYNLARSLPYSFLYVKLAAKKKKDMFFQKMISN